MPKALDDWQLKLIRSGDVIPRITKVLDRGKWWPLTVLQRKMVNGKIVEKTVDNVRIVDHKVASTIPTHCPACKTKLRYTDSGVDLVCPNDKCPGRHAENVQAFFTVLGVKDVAEGTIEQLRLAGLNTVAKIVQGATAERLQRLEGYGQRKAELVAQAVAGALKNVPLARVMHASGVFHADAHSLGSTRLQEIIDAVGVGAIARGSVNELRSKLATCKGIGPQSVDLFIQALPAWREFYAPISKYHTLPDTGAKTLDGLVACFTEFRSPEAQAFIEAHGGRVAGMSKNVKVLFAASLGSVKCRKADEFGIPVVSQDEMWNWLKARAGK